MFRAGIVHLLEQTDDIRVVGEIPDGASAVTAVGEVKPDLVLMDISMPCVSGSAASREILQAFPDTRILVLSSYVEQTDVLDALDAGVAGYLLKDADPDELLAGIRSAVRDESPMAARAARRLVTAWRERGSGGDVATFDGGRLAIDRIRHEVRVDGRTCDLTITEYELLVALTRRPGRVYTRLELTYRARGHEFEGYERTIDGHIKNLRRKIETEPASPRFVVTVRGVGYRLGVQAG
jgi:DNA-binding response OmpR family regulator